MTDTKDVHERIARALATTYDKRSIAAGIKLQGDEVTPADREAAAAAYATLTLSDHIAAVEAAGVPVLKLLADAVDVIGSLVSIGGAFDVEATLAELNAAIALIMANRNAE